MEVNLPKKCFISHSYGDAKTRDRLIDNLPPHVEAVVFPPITVAPEDLVSNHLIEALLNCDGVIYLNGGHSIHSFWVAFERDYALRAGKQVFSADVKNLEVEPHSGGTLDLATFASYCRQDRDRTNEIAAFLKQERHFDLWLDSEELKPGDLWEERIRLSLADRLQRGGYLVVFWSRAASENENILKEIRQAVEGIESPNDRVLFALLDDTPLPKYWLSYKEPGVQLYSDDERTVSHRVDDLVVRLYWLIYRKTEYRHLEKNDA